MAEDQIWGISTIVWVRAVFECQREAAEKRKRARLELVQGEVQVSMVSEKGAVSRE